MKKIVLVLATGALAATGAAIAQPAAGERAPATRAAAIERSDRMFARMDANGDGVLSDADKAERITQRFSRMDSDGNGMLSEAEFVSAHEARAEKRAERMAARAERRGGEGMRGGRGKAGRLMAGADADNDGQITQAEFQGAILARFDRADADGDGTVTREERQAARQQMRAAR